MHCTAFRNHYEVYCRGIWTPEKLLRLAHHLDRIKRFCPNYKRVCLKEWVATLHAKKFNFRKEHTKKGLNKSARKRLEKELKYELGYDDILKRVRIWSLIAVLYKYPVLFVQFSCSYRDGLRDRRITVTVCNLQKILNQSLIEIGVDSCDSDGSFVKSLKALNHVGILFIVSISDSSVFLERLKRWTTYWFRDLHFAKKYMVLIYII